MSNTLELVIQELQNRIGQITSNYELQMARLKAQATEEIQRRDKENKIKRIECIKGTCEKHITEL